MSNIKTTQIYNIPAAVNALIESVRASHKYEAACQSLMDSAACFCFLNAFGWKAVCLRWWTECSWWLWLKVRRAREHVERVWRLQRMAWCCRTFWNITIIAVVHLLSLWLVDMSPHNSTISCPAFQSREASSTGMIDDSFRHMGSESMD